MKPITPKMRRALYDVAVDGGRFDGGPWVATYRALERRGLVRVTHDPRMCFPYSVEITAEGLRAMGYPVGGAA